MTESDRTVPGMFCPDPKCTPEWSGAGVVGAWPDQLLALVFFDDLPDPSCGSPGGKDQQWRVLGQGKRDKAKIDVGWVAHCFEQAERGRLVQPAAVYSDGFDRGWVPLAERNN